MVYQGSELVMLRFKKMLINLVCLCVSPQEYTTCHLQQSDKA